MKPKSRYLLVTLVALAAMVLPMLGSSPAVGVARAADTKTLTVAFPQEPDNLNYFYSNLSFAQWAVQLGTAALWDYDEHLKAVPVLVAEVPTVANGGTSKDGKTTTIKLKKGLKWSDGEPLTADDVVFTYNMIKDKANNMAQGAQIQEAVDKAEKVDDVTVKLTTNTPQPYAENLAGSQNFNVLPAHILQPIYDKDKSIEKADYNQNPTVFSGAYMLKEWKRGASMTWVVNPNYEGKKPSIETLVLQFFPDPESAYAAFAAGQIDYVPNLQPSDPPKIAGLTKNATFVNVYGGFRESLWLNVRTDKFPEAGHPALKDVRVRQAIRLGVNRRGLVKNLLGDAVPVAESLYASSPFENKKLKFVEYDPAAAEKLLDAAGWVKGADGVRESKGVPDVKDGTKLELKYSTTPAAQRKANQAVIQQDLAKIGIKVTLENFPADNFFGQFKDGGITSGGKFDIAEYANNTVTTNPANARVFFCDDIPSDAVPGGQNNVGYCNPKLDDLWKVTEQALDPAEGQKAADEIQTILAEDVPNIILYDRPDQYTYNPTRFVGKPRIGAGLTNQWFDISNWQLK
ncbi:MAG: peptide ABC transporter substrate-binding protein [Chloroflexota bacterium]